MMKTDPVVSLTASQRSKIRRLSQPKDAEPGEDAGELNIVPYLDIVTNVMMFVLVTISATFISSVESSPPSVGGERVRSEILNKGLNLSAFITNDGISLKTTSGNISTGCQGTGSGITVPKVSGSNNYKSLRECAKRLKNAKSEFKDEVQVMITANPNIELQTIIDTMDALREDILADGSKELLFPEVHFGVAR